MALFSFPEIGSLVTAHRRENNPLFGAGLSYYYQCKITQLQFAVHLWHCANVIILTLSQTMPITLTLHHSPTTKPVHSGSLSKVIHKVLYLPLVIVGAATIKKTKTAGVKVYLRRYCNFKTHSVNNELTSLNEK